MNIPASSASLYPKTESHNISFSDENVIPLNEEHGTDVDANKSLTYFDRLSVAAGFGEDELKDSNSPDRAAAFSVAVVLFASLPLHIVVLTWLGLLINLPVMPSFAVASLISLMFFQFDRVGVIAINYARAISIVRNGHLTFYRVSQGLSLIHILTLPTICSV